MKLTHLSSGTLPDNCPECNSNSTDEGFFSWSSCDLCSSSLGGTRYIAHGLDENEEIVHLEICEDCLLNL
jgi:hypothetical protein